MSQNDGRDPAGIEKPIASDTYSTVEVHMNNTVGAVFLGIATLVLLIALLRSEARNQALTRQFLPFTQEEVHP